MVHRLFCASILTLVALTGSCTIPEKTPLYTGPLFGDSVDIYPLPYPVNTAESEMFPTISRDWRWLYFGRRRYDTTWLFRTEIDSGHVPVISRGVERFLPSNATRVYFAAAGLDPHEFIVVGCDLADTRGGCDLYKLLLDKNFAFESITNIAEVNSEEWESTPALSCSGDELWFTRMIYVPIQDRSRGLLDRTGNHFDLMISQRTAEEWGEPVNAGDSINSRWDETSPSLGFIDSVLFFISNRPGGYGAADIYVSFRHPDGTWGRALNAGPKINTEYSESSVLVMPDNRHLLISSDRGVDGSQGGEDIYVVEFIFDDQPKP